MRIRRGAGCRARGLLSATILIIIVILLPAGSSSQAAEAPSQIKKPLIYQVGNVVRINAAGPRPLLQALEALQGKYGWIVDYEDPQYPAEDLAPNRQSLPTRRHTNVRSFWEGGFTVEFDSAPDGRPEEDSVLAMVIDAYNQSNAAGQFEVRKEQDGRFAVVGVGVRNPSGEIASQRPILDLQITLAAKRRNADATISLICRKLSEQSKIQVTPGGISDSVHGRGAAVVGGIGVPARTLLSRTLMGEHLGWRLLYDSSARSYELAVVGLSQ